jgi:hypothetical protein
MQTRQNQPQAACMLRLNTRLAPSQKKPFKALVSEARDHS